MNKIKMKLTGYFEQHFRRQDVTLTLDRDQKTLTVRPLRSQRTYTLDLNSVATHIVRTNQLAEANRIRQGIKREKAA